MSPGSASLPGPPNEEAGLVQEAIAEARYIYKPIEPRTQIRILELDPPNERDAQALSGNLIIVDLADNPTYEALSYAWGDPVFPDAIHLRTGRLPLTRNLASALRQLRFPNSPRKLWIDAVCINQSENNEKSHQVMLMSKIYRNTTGVLVWLGAGSQDTNGAMEIIKELVEEAKILDIVPEYPVDIMRSTSEDGMIKWLELFRRFSRSNGSYIRAFLLQPWFRRLWVVQEVVLAPQITFVCGTYSLESQYLGIPAMAVSLYSIYGKIGSTGWGNSDDFVDVFGLFASMEEQRLCKRTSTPQPKIRELMREHGHRQCSNALDICYAILGMSDSKNDIHLEVNYESSVEDLFQHIAYEYLQIGDLGILDNTGSHALRDKSRSTKVSSSHSQLPSWVPDWRIDWGGRTSDGFFAARDIDPRMILERSNLPKIAIQGASVDIIKHAKLVDITVPREDLNNDWFREWFEQMKLVQEIIAGVTQKPLYPSGEHISTVLPQMLVANIAGIEEQAGEGIDGFIARLRDIELYYQHFENFLQDPSECNQEQVQFLQTDACMVTTVIGAQRLIITKDGYIGFGPEGMQEDDQIVVFDGSGMPFVLRPAEISSIERGSVGQVSEGPEEWEIISKCYLHGWMNNEILRPEYRERKRMFWMV